MAPGGTNDVVQARSTRVWICTCSTEQQSTADANTGCTGSSPLFSVKCRNAPHRWRPFAASYADHECGVGEGEAIGRALCEIGRFDDALPWFERAIEATEKQDVFGRVDTESLATSMKVAGRCLAGMGEANRAKGWFEVDAAAYGQETEGAVLADAVRSVDWQARNVRFREKADEGLVEEVLAKVRTLFDG